MRSARSNASNGSVRSHASRHSYRTVGATSSVDESLFGKPRRQVCWVCEFVSDVLQAFVGFTLLSHSELSLEIL